MRLQIKNLLGRSASVFANYPMVLLMAFLAAVSFMSMLDVNYQLRKNDFVFLKFGLTACLGISLLFAVKILSQRMGRTLLPQISAVLFLVFFYFLLPKEEKFFTEPYAYLLLPSFLLSHLLVSFVGFIRNNNESQFWQYNKNLFINAVLTAIFTAVLTGGVMLAILAVDQLFNLDLPENLYFRTFYFLAIFGSCFIFLQFAGNGLPSLQKESAYPEVLKFFTQYILIPLLLLYAGILYLYAGKIVLQWELPRGWVSYLILAYAVVGLLGLLLVHPLKKDDSRSWVKIFSNIFYYSLLPLLILLFWAIFTRVLEYGYTEPRYFVLLLAIWLSSVTLYFIFFKGNIRFIPASLFVFGIFALAFSYFNAFAVAKRSQKAELDHLLQANQLLESGKIIFSKKVAASAAQEISNKFKFLADRGEVPVLLPYLKANEQKNLQTLAQEGKFYKIESDIRNLFVDVTVDQPGAEMQRLELVSASAFAAVDEYEYVMALTPGLQDKPESALLPVSVKYDTENMLQVTADGQTWDLGPFIKKMLAQNRSKSGTVNLPEISAEKRLGNYELKVIFSNLVSEGGGDHGIYYEPPLLLLRKRK